MARSRVKKTTPEQKRLRPVVVTTEQRGIFFGYTKGRRGTSIRLLSARNAFYFDSVEGFAELATKGPGPRSKIGCRCDLELVGVSAVLECSTIAVERWERAAWVD